MTRLHNEAGADEIFVGNCQRDGDTLVKLQMAGLKAARLGEVAYDIDGKPLPREYAPLLIKRSDADLYDDVMMTRTFGPHWRRNR